MKSAHHSFLQHIAPFLPKRVLYVAKKKNDEHSSLFAAYDIWNTDMQCYFELSCNSETSVALGRWGPISAWVGLSLSRIGKKTDHVWRCWHALDENEYTNPNIAVSETRFLSVLVQRWTSCKGSHSRYGERWLQGTTWHSPAPCHLSLLRDRVSEHVLCPSFSILH